jgi:hypothetical protein
MRTLTCRNWGGLGIVISLLAIVLALPATVAAQTNSGTNEEVKVIAHLPLSGIHVNEMFLQRRGNKDYLYLHRPTRQAFALVDVSKPEKPVLLERVALQEPARTQVDLDASNPLLAISVAPDDHPHPMQAKANADGQPGAASLPTETLRLLDLSNPKNPRVLKSFSGVTSFLPDDSRKLIYIVNQEGLTIVRHRQSRPMPLCTSEDALTQEPNCQ